MIESIKRAALILALFGAGCGPAEDGPNVALKREAVEQYAVVVSTSYTDSVAAATELDAKIDVFLSEPSASSFDQARDAWLAAREPYGQTEGYRFYGGPIDDEEMGLEQLINASPVDERVLDITRNDSSGGLIGSSAVLTKELLVARNQQGGPANVTTGFHAIEFLLWGQDSSDPSNGMPGQRPHTDYLDMADGGTAPNASRRRQVLSLAADLLVDHLQGVEEQWLPDEQNFRAEFVEQDPDAALTEIFTGIVRLGGKELAQMRMAAALASMSQEDEQSDFSDATHLDLLANAKSVQNVYLGAYGIVNGVGLDELVSATDAELDARIKSELERTIAAIEAIPAPFDQALGTEDGRAKIQAAIDASSTQTDSLIEAASALGLTVTLE